MGVTAPEYIYSEYEKAIFKGFHNVFPETTPRGDDAHFKAAVRMKISKLGLKRVYESNQEFQTFVRRFWALSMVPVDDVVQVWEELVLPTCPDPEEEWDPKWCP